MTINRFILTIFTALLMILGTGAASGQTYPSKVIRIVTYNAGGGNDFASRIIAQGISGPLGQPVIVDNRGGGYQPGEIVAKAPPDGYTLLVAGVIYTIGHLLQDTPYDPIRDFEPISTVGVSPLLLVVHPSLPVKSVKELIALAKARPGELNYVSSGIGGGTHLASELFKSMTGVNIVRIDYKTAAPGVLALMAGECQIMFVASSSVAPHIKSGRLRALAVTTNKPSILAPGLPPMSATLPGYESSAFTVIVAPAKTPRAVVTRLNEEVVRMLNQPDAKQKFLAIGVEAQSSTPEELTAATKAEIARMSKVIKEAGIKAN